MPLQAEGLLHRSVEAGRRHVGHHQDPQLPPRIHEGIGGRLPVEPTPRPELWTVVGSRGHDGPDIQPKFFRALCLPQCGCPARRDGLPLVAALRRQRYSWGGGPPQPLQRPPRRLVGVVIFLGLAGGGRGASTSRFLQLRKAGGIETAVSGKKGISHGNGVGANDEAGDGPFPGPPAAPGLVGD